MFEALPEEKKQAASAFIAFLVAQTKAEHEQAIQDAISDSQQNEHSGFGCMKGKIWMSPDFDAPIEDFKDYI